MILNRNLSHSQWSASPISNSTFIDKLIYWISITDILIYIPKYSPKIYSSTLNQLFFRLVQTILTSIYCSTLILSKANWIVLRSLLIGILFMNCLVSLMAFSLLGWWEFSKVFFNVLAELLREFSVIENVRGYWTSNLSSSRKIKTSFWFKGFK